MIEWSQLGKWLLVLGIGLALLGGALILAAKLLKGNAIPWLGHLPGDIHIQGKGISCYFPLATGILLSILLTVILNVIVRLLNKH